jgi:hypothetical protein
MQATRDESKMQVGGYSGIDTATGKDKDVAAVWRGGEIIATFEGKGSFGKALAFAGIRDDANH